MYSVAATDSPTDVCVVLSTALLADGDLDAPELHALEAMHIDHALGLPPGRFREVLHEVCGELLRDNDCGCGLSMLEPERISEALRMLHEPQHRFRSTARLIDLMREGDPMQLECKLLDPSRLDAALDRIVDPNLRFWTCATLLHLMSADGELHRNEIAILEHVLERWGVTIAALRTALQRAAC